MKYFIISLILFISSTSFASNHLYERDYQEYWCNKNKGQTEVILRDLARCDCELTGYAVEFDFVEKWAEAVGQSLYYASMLNKQPGIVLIVKDNTDYTKYIKRVFAIERIIDIDIVIWVITNTENGIIELYGEIPLNQY